MTDSYSLLDQITLRKYGTNYKYNNHDIVRYNVLLPPSQSLRYLPNRKSLCSLAVFLVLFLNFCLFSKEKKRYVEKKWRRTLKVLCLLEKTITIIMLVAAGTLRQIMAVLPQLTAVVVFATLIAVCGSFVFGAAATIIII